MTKQRLARTKRQVDKTAAVAVAQVGYNIVKLYYGTGAARLTRFFWVRFTAARSLYMHLHSSANFVLVAFAHCKR